MEQIRNANFSASLRDSSLGEGAFGFMQISDIVMPSSPRRVAAKLTGGVLNITQQLYIALSVACGRETPSAEFGKQIPWNKFAMRIFPRHLRWQLKEFEEFFKETAGFFTLQLREARGFC